MDRKAFSDAYGVPTEAMRYSEFISEGRWNDVDEPLRQIYQDASDKLGRDFPYPTD